MGKIEHRPKENLFTPSNAFNLVIKFRRRKNIWGSIRIINKTIFQDYKGSKAYTPIYNVERK